MSNSQLSEQSIFMSALEKCGESRSAYLDEACRDDRQLREGVEALLAAHERLPSLDAPHLLAQSATTVALEPTSEGPGTIIGRYKLLELIGEGGFGLVFMAEQKQPLRRKVALKVIKPGMDTRQVIARFEAERQALALMDHPNIAGVFDGGETDAGRPYFVMELVRGLPITEYCDQNQLSPRERLALFLHVCQAVQHAHLKGIIHRDLKPSNILVTLHDGTPLVKVIDFGIAKAIGSQLTERTVFTNFTQMVGTPAYMSPEQAGLSALDVDTRTDVYALGVLLYELLTGRTPFDKERLKEADYDEIRRMIREEEPPKPSTRMSTLGKAAMTVATQRRSDAKLLSQLFRGELDWIVMKALEKDRTRRYETANGLARDVERFLHNEAVEACPPTTSYKLRKFAQKHQKLLATAAAFTALMLLGVVASGWQALRATHAEVTALDNEQLAKANAAQAQMNEKEAKQKRDEVQALNEQLLATQAQLRSTLYAAHMNLAKHAWDLGGINRIRELLEANRPKAGETDLRGFEWNYLHRLSQQELLSFKENRGVPLSVAVSPDGKRIASGSNQGTVRVSDAETGLELLTCRGLAGQVTSVAFSPDGRHLAGGSWRMEAGAVIVWDAHNGKEVFSFNLKGRVWGVDFSSDGKYLAASSNAWEKTKKTVVGAKVNVWDAKTGKELHILTGGGRHVAFSPDSKQLACASEDKTVNLWDTQTGKETLTFRGHGAEVYGVAFSPDGKQLASASADQTVKIWDAQVGKELLTFGGHSAEVFCVAFSPDSRRVASGGVDQTVKVWDAQSGLEILAHKGHADEVWSVAFFPDGKRIVSAADELVRVLEAQVGNPLILRGHTLPVSCVAFGPDSKLLVSSSCADNPKKSGEVMIWETQTGKELLTLNGHRLGVYSVDISADGKRIASASNDQVVQVWDVQTGLLLFSGSGTSVAFSPDGKSLATVSGKGLKVLDAQTGKEILSMNAVAGGPFHSLKFSPDGKRLACANSKAITVWDVQTAQLLLTLETASSYVAFSPDGKRLAGEAEGNTLRIWNSHTGLVLLTLKGHTQEVTGLAFSPDGKRLASCSWDKTVRVWDTLSGHELLALQGRGGNRNAVAFSPDGHRLAAGSNENGIVVWDATPLGIKN